MSYFLSEKNAFSKKTHLVWSSYDFLCAGGRHKLWPEERGLGSFPYSFTPISSFIQRKKLRPERGNDLPRVPSVKANLYLSERCFPYKVIPGLQVLGLECFFFFARPALLGSLACLQHLGPASLGSNTAQYKGLILSGRPWGLKLSSWHTARSRRCAQGIHCLYSFVLMWRVLITSFHCPPESIFSMTISRRDMSLSSRVHLCSWQ